MTRRSLVAIGSVATAAVAPNGTVAAAEAAPPATDARLGGDAKPAGRSAPISGTPTGARPEPQADCRQFSATEVQLAFRCHGMQAEFLREPVTPLGAHFLLMHFDVPRLSVENYAIDLGGHVRRPRRVSLRELQRQQVLTRAVTLACAGTGRSTMQPRAAYVPWFRTR